MARPIWTGVLTFGLVTLPVGLYTATEDHTVHFHQLQRGTSDRIRNKRVNERTGKEVDSQKIVKGYDLGDGEYVVVEPEELEEIAPGRSKVIDMAGFVDLREVEPVYFDRTYYVGPRGKEYLTALRAQPNALVLHTLHWADEVRDPAGVVTDLPDRRGKAGGRELKTAEQLIDALSIDWEPGEYRDTYEERVKKLVEAKREGEEIVGEAEPPEATNVVDLMEALRRSVEQSGSGGSRGKRSAGSGGKQSGGRRRDSGKGLDLGSLPKAELYERAGAAGVRGRSKMTRDQLVEALSGKGAAA
ncbi:Ku protein [Streptomyces sp. L2]|uniref:non-homologous end joining protein Ku n=1 Tax=Streptomyces sp. L2 TaxID=2162665 RepID=UPI00101163A9|nr:Ku protein [Streptomyces sp. L2]